MRFRTFWASAHTSGRKSPPKTRAGAWPGCCPWPGMTQMSSEALAVLDLSVIEAMRSLGESDAFAEIAHMFLEDVPPDLSALGAAIASGSAASVAQIAHSLRGNALGIGAIRMVPVCAAIECAARAGSLKEAAACAGRLEREFEATRQALQVLIQ